MVLKKLKGCGFSGCMLMLALLLVGGFHEYISCALSAAMCIYLLLRLGKGEGLRIRKDLLTSAVIAISLGYGLTCLWAVDSGVALVGFVKFLPLVLYLVCLQQQEDTETTLQVLPYYGAVLTVLSVIGMRIPGLQRLFEVSDRLAGTFQYPNTFALFLLVCQLLLWKKTPKKIWDYVTIAVLLAGLLYTGSRTVFVVAILANIGMLFVYSKKRGRNILLIGMAAAVLVGVILLSGSSVLRRYLSISLTESTFVGRLLYWVDALPLLLKYPFGMGYKGYFTSNRAFKPVCIPWLISIMSCCSCFWMWVWCR